MVDIVNDMKQITKSLENESFVDARKLKLWMGNNLLPALEQLAEYTQGGFGEMAQVLQQLMQQNQTADEDDDSAPIEIVLAAHELMQTAKILVKSALEASAYTEGDVQKAKDFLKHTDELLDETQEFANEYEDEDEDDSAESTEGGNQ